MVREYITPVKKKIKVSAEEWDEIILRFRAFFKVQSNTQLAKLLGISKEGLVQFRPRGSLPYDKMIHIAVENGASLNWLFTGRGEMGSDPQLQSENEKLRIQIIRQDAIIEYLKKELKEERLK